MGIDFIIIVICPSHTYSMPNFVISFSDESSIPPQDQLMSASCSAPSTAVNTESEIAFSDPGKSADEFDSHLPEPARTVQGERLLESVSTQSIPEPVAEETETQVIGTDPAKWVLNDVTIDYLLSREIEQNLQADFSVTKTFYPSLKRHRSLSKHTFQRILKNGQVRDRKYLSYSTSVKAVFCVPCRLFGGTTKLATTGYADWSNIDKVVESHENSAEHMKSLVTYRRRMTTKNRIDTELKKQIEAECNYWQNVLRRVVAVVKKLTSRGLSLRGKNEIFGSNQNGNFMMSLELIAEFDPFLSEHIAKHGNPGSGRTSYLSSTIYEEFVTLLASKVVDTFVTEMKESKYFSLIVDSTPDISHVDELSVILRYVPENFIPVERFLAFLPNVGHKAKDMAEAVLAKLGSHSIDICDCRGQSYDNAKNMSGIYNGLQAKIKAENSLAIYVPCSAHSLNLIGTHTVDSIFEAQVYFDHLEKLYSFFVASTNRWESLMNELQPGQKVVKRATGTRWASKFYANASFRHGWKEFILVLTSIADNNLEKPIVRSTALGLKKALSRFETVLMSVIWCAILERFHKVISMLQGVNIHLQHAIDLYDSLLKFLNDLRTNEMFNIFLEEARKIRTEEFEYDQRRQPKRKLASDETRNNEVHYEDGKEKFKIEVYFSILDMMCQELREILAGYREIHRRFNFLINIRTMSLTEISEQAASFQEIYNVDIDAHHFQEECLHFKNYLETTDEDKKFEENLSAFLNEHDLDQVFPNVCIAFRIFLCLAITNCSAERSFSVLKRIKNYLRSTMGEIRLNSLATLSIESALVEHISFDDIIYEFAHLKARKKMISA